MKKKKIKFLLPMCKLKLVKHPIKNVKSCNSLNLEINEGNILIYCGFDFLCLNIQIFFIQKISNINNEQPANK